MAIETIDNFGIYVGRNIDSRYGPYVDTDDANEAINEIFRYRGLTVLITGSGDIVEYWYYEGIDDINLVPKGAIASFSGVDTQVVFYSSSTAISGSPSITYNYLSNHFFVTGSSTLSGSTFLPGINDISQQYVLTYNPVGGQVYYTSSNALSAVSTPLDIQDDSDPVISSPTFINFTGSGVSASVNGAGVDVYIPGDGGTFSVTGLDGQIIFFSGSTAISGSSDFIYDYINHIIKITGSLNISGSITLTGSIDISGSTNTVGNSTITGSLNISGSTNTIGTSTLTGSLLITGSTIIIGTSVLTGSSITSGSTTVIGTSTLTGSFNTSGSTNIIGISTFTGSLLVTGSINTIGTSILTGSFNTSGSTNTIGISILTGSFNTSGSTTVIGTSILTGSFNTSGSTTVIGISTITGSLLVTGSTTVIGTSILTGSFNTSGSTTVIGTSTLTGSFNTSGSTTIVGTSTLTGSFNTSGSINTIGTSILTGSFNTSGSTNIIGTSTLTGSFNNSGSTTIVGTSTLTGSFNTSGSTNTVGTSTLTGSLLITGSTTLTGSMFVTGAISASSGPNTVGFYGTASWAQNASTSSYALSVNLDIQDEGIPIISSPTFINFTGSNVTAISNGSGVDVFVDISAAATASFTNLAIWEFTHSLNSRYVVIQTLDTEHKQIIPEIIELVDTASARITFPTTESGYAIATIGGAGGGGGIVNFNSTSSIIGNDSDKSFDIVHNFGTRDLHVTVYENGNNYETVYADIYRPNINTVRVNFAGTIPPSSQQFIVYISQ